MSIVKIVITGGPCAGKSTALSRIEQELTNKGYKVFVVSETATEVINGGIKPNEVGLIPFQKTIFEIQSAKESAFKKRAEEYSLKQQKDCIIVYDRGLMDAKAFMTEKEFKAVLSEFNQKEVKVRDSYDAVMHLITAANGAEEYYTLGNNSARSETPEQACKVDKQGIKAWTGHPHLRIIDNKNKTFERKIDKLMDEIYSLLGEPIPVEIERKYLLKMPDIQKLIEKYDVTKVNICQTYLKSTPDIERRVRQRGIAGEFSFYYTEKSGVGISRVEKEKKITERQYLEYLMEADTSLRQIIKDRYCFVYDNSYIELDIYPFWTENAIVEVELTKETDIVNLPPEFEVIKEVTDDNRFKNHSLAIHTDIL